MLDTNLKKSLILKDIAVTARHMCWLQTAFPTRNPGRSEELTAAFGPWIEAWGKFDRAGKDALESERLQVSGVQSMLTEAQISAAKKLLEERPEVIPGTRAIINLTAQANWFTRVTNTMTEMGVTGVNQVKEFCDIAGVAD